MKKLFSILILLAACGVRATISTTFSTNTPTVVEVATNTPNRTESVADFNPLILRAHNIWADYFYGSLRFAHDVHGGAILPGTIPTNAVDAAFMAYLGVAGSGSQTNDLTKLTNAVPVALTGDATASANLTNGGANQIAVTFATVNGNVGSAGSATVAPVVTVNGKGLVTAVSTATITPAVGSITGLGSGVGTFLATPSSANLRGALTDESGTGVAIFPTLTSLTVGDILAWSGTTWTNGPASAGSATWNTNADGTATFANAPTGYTLHLSGTNSELGTNITFANSDRHWISGQRIAVTDSPYSTILNGSDMKLLKSGNSFFGWATNLNVVGTNKGVVNLYSREGFDDGGENNRIEWGINNGSVNWSNVDHSLIGWNVGSAITNWAECLIGWTWNSLYYNDTTLSSGNRANNAIGFSYKSLHRKFIASAGFYDWASNFGDDATLIHDSAWLRAYSINATNWENLTAGNMEGTPGEINVNGMSYSVVMADQQMDLNGFSGGVVGLATSPGSIDTVSLSFLGVVLGTSHLSQINNSSLGSVGALSTLTNINHCQIGSIYNPENGTVINDATGWNVGSIEGSQNPTIITNATGLLAGRLYGVGNPDYEAELDNTASFIGNGDASANHGVWGFEEIGSASAITFRQRGVNVDGTNISLWLEAGEFGGNARGATNMGLFTSLNLEIPSFTASLLSFQSSEQGIALSGARLGDTVIIGCPSNMPASYVPLARIASNNFINLRIDVISSVNVSAYTNIWKFRALQ